MGRDLGRVVIIGAGLAGGATAFGLVQRGTRDILLLEQEEIPGYYASGRNAAMVRELVPHAEIRRLIRHGTKFLSSPPAAFPASPGFRRVAARHPSFPSLAFRRAPASGFPPSTDRVAPAV